MTCWSGNGSKKSMYKWTNEADPKSRSGQNFWDVRSQAAAVPLTARACARVPPPQMQSGRHWHSAHAAARHPTMPTRSAERREHTLHL
eukprot:626102-Pleurochrysis_carterae.AAC.2